MAQFRLPCWPFRELLGAGCVEARASPLLLLLSRVYLVSLIMCASAGTAGHIGLCRAQLVQVIADPYQLAGLCLPYGLADVVSISRHGAKSSASLRSPQVNVHRIC